MGLYYSVCVLDLVSTPGIERIQDLGLLKALDAQQSKIHPTTSPKPSPSSLFLTFPRDTPGLNIRELMEVWAGWRDDVTGEWVTHDPAGDPCLPFGGYIVKQRTRLDGNEKQFEIDLVDYSILFTKTAVLGWPTFVTNANPAEYLNIGFPEGYSVRDWLIGHTWEGQPWDGVLPAHLGNGVRFGGVDPIFDTIVINRDTMPGFLNVVPGLWDLRGYYGATSLQKVILSLADCALFTYAKNYTGGPDLVVGYWMAAVPDGQRIVPEFRMANMADDTTTTPDLYIACDFPLRSGEIPIADYWHERDANNVQTAPVIFGVGGDPTVPGLPLAYAEYDNPTRRAAYPTAYQLRPGWAGEPLFDARLHTQATAQFLIDYVGYRVWGAQGSYMGTIDVPAIPGWRAQLRNPSESLQRVFPITDVSAQANGSYDLRLGFTQLTPADVLKGGMADVLLFQEERNYLPGGILDPARHDPATGRLLPPTVQPTSPNQNHITSGYTDTPAVTVQGTTNVRTTDSGDPIPVDASNVFQAKTPPDPITGVATVATSITMQDGRPHPQFFAGLFTTDETQGPFVIQWDLDFARVKLKGTGSVTLNKNGAAAAGPFSGVGTHLFTTPVHYSEAANDDWSLTAAGVSGTLSFGLGEA